MDENQQAGGEPIAEEHIPRGTLLRMYCRIGAQMFAEYADGIGGKTEQYLGLSMNCANSVTRRHLEGHLDYYERLLGNTNMLKKAEAAAVAKQLKAFSQLVFATNYVVHTSEGHFVATMDGLRKMTFWETLKWKWFGAVPYAKQANDMISEAYDYAGVVSVVEVDLVE